jgi:archaellum biogenesis protein FlaJ (TadC family)
VSQVPALEVVQVTGFVAIIIGLAFWAAWLLAITAGIVDMIVRGA